MGYIVEVDGRSVWEPSRRVAELFLSQIRGLESVFEVPSGVSSPVADEIAVDAAELRTFLVTVLELLARSGSRPLETLVAGPLQLCIELHEKSAGTAFVGPSIAEPLMDRIRGTVGGDGAGVRARVRRVRRMRRMRPCGIWPCIGCPRM